MTTYRLMPLLRTLTTRKFTTASRTLFSPTYSAKMKEAIVNKGPKVEIKESPIPTPEPSQVVTKVVVSGSNPKDWKRPEWGGEGVNQGDDIAGVVHSVGSEVVEFKEGDRVAAFHQMMSPGGSYGEYAVSWDHATFHIPKKTSFEGETMNSGITKAHATLTYSFRGCDYPAGRNDGCIWSLSTLIPSSTMASCAHFNPFNRLWCRRCCRIVSTFPK